MASLLLSLAHSLGLLCLVLVVYGTAIRQFSASSRLRSPTLGVLFGLAAVISMLGPVPIVPGVLADARTVMIALAAPFGGVPAAVIATGIAGLYRFWEGGAGAYAGILGLAVTCLIGVAFTSVVHPANNVLHFGHLLMLGCSTGFTFLSILILPQDIAWKIFSSMGPPLLIVHVSGVMVIGVFLSRELSRIKSVMALQEREALLSAVFENSPDSLLVTRVKGAGDHILTYANPTTFALYGITREQAIGSRMCEFLPPDRVNRLRSTMDACAHYGEIVHDRTTLTLDGRETTWDIKQVPIKDAQGATTLIAIIGRDITADELAAVELKAARQMAENANRQQSQFMASLSHELRTPLTSIIGFGDLIQKASHGPISAEYSEMAGFIRDSGEHVLELINEILDNAKAEAGQIQLSESKVDLASVIAFAERTVTPRAQHAGVTVTCSVDPDARIVMGDERRIRQALLNLLANAVKYTPAGGTIRVKSRLEPDRSLVIEVADEGMGIAEDDLDRVLEPFTRTKAAECSGIEGTGLGLPLTKRLIELHGGTILINSQVNIGTTVKLLLPPHRVQHTGNGSQYAQRAVTERQTILLAEDDPLIRTATSILLQEWGYDVIEAANGNEALVILRSNRHLDILFTDLVMPPGLNGAELAMQAEHLRPGIAILLTSGFAAHAVMSGQEIGRGFDLLPKPYNALDLQRRLCALVGTAKETLAVETRIPAFP